MEYNDFINKILSNSKNELNEYELYIIAKYYDIFGITKTVATKLHKYVDKLNNKQAQEDKINELLNDIDFDGNFILNKLDNNSIIEDQLIIDFRSEFLSILNSLDNRRLCFFVDKFIGISKSQRFNFFGTKSLEIVYHEINSCICKNLGLTLTFKIFGNGIKNNYLKIDYEKINREDLIKCISNLCINKIYILISIAKVIKNIDIESLDKKSTSRLINIEIKKYKDIIVEENKIVFGTKERPNKIEIYTSDIFNEDYDFEDGDLDD